MLLLALRRGRGGEAGAGLLARLARRPLVSSPESGSAEGAARVRASSVRCGTFVGGSAGAVAEAQKLSGNGAGDGAFGALRVGLGHPPPSSQLLLAAAVSRSVLESMDAALTAARPPAEVTEQLEFCAEAELEGAGVRVRVASFGYEIPNDRLHALVERGVESDPLLALLGPERVKSVTVSSQSAIWPLRAGPPPQFSLPPAF
jgi:hypothetical protein